MYCTRIPGQSTVIVLENKQPALAGPTRDADVKPAKARSLLQSSSSSPRAAKVKDKDGLDSERERDSRRSEG